MRQLAGAKDEYIWAYLWATTSACRLCRILFPIFCANPSILRLLIEFIADLVTDSLLSVSESHPCFLERRVELKSHVGIDVAEEWSLSEAFHAADIIPIMRKTGAIELT